ncbi:hypothetical protein F5Y08DRAFT_347525 [Xylaria arbuscula]|nr:hypothetical protein F5Y08DRAFT_347525 [Xylaria arbuscula]
MDFNKEEEVKARELCLHQVFEYTAKQSKSSIAVVCGEVSLTYGQLNELVNSLARGLIMLKVKKDDLIGVVLHRSVNLVAMLLAILKTGAAYMPIDPAFPVERISCMVEDACPKFLIVEPELLRVFGTIEIACLGVKEVMAAGMAGGHITGSNVIVQGQDLAYVMYTSGSTGKPKGVEIMHDNILNLLFAMRQEPGCSKTDRLLAITTVSFDMAVLEIFLPLICGGTTILAQHHEIRDPAALIRLMAYYQVTIMQGTPAIWQMLLDSGWDGQPRVPKIFCGGEALSRTLADRLLTCGNAIWNMYGPTETTVYTSIARVREDGDITIGRSIPNTSLYVLDKNLSAVPLGSVGELFIGGAGVARGYHNKDELSRSRFLKIPLSDGLVYRTGDLVHYSDAGLLYIGRIDRQVKVRGYRIELGDIEAVLTKNKLVSAAVVMCRGGRLVAYCVRHWRAIEQAKDVATTFLDKLRPWLAKRLPEYMIPSFFVELELLPMTINGKVNRDALPDPTVSYQAMEDDRVGGNTERQLLTIWSDILGHHRITSHDSFFEVGGDSIRLVRVQKELERHLGRLVPVAKLFEHYTIRALAAYLDGQSPSPLPKVIPRPTLETGNNDIAVISMSCRLPGDISTPEEFWDLLKSDGDAISDVPEDRWEDDGRFGSDRPYCRRGGFVHSVNAFDIDFFGISPREAHSLDPSQYMMLETCWEGFERAGYTVEKLRGSQTGVFIGVSNILGHLGLSPSTSKNLADLDGYTVTGSASGTISGRIAYQMGLEGPVMTIDTACSSSLVATHLACTALRQEECDMAVSGGVSLLMNQGLHVEFGRLRGMSSDGRCRAFSADADGTGWSEGSVAIILKRLSDAQRDGDEIRAVIRGTVVNHDGRSASLTTPSGPAQQRLLRMALKSAKLQPDDIDYIEAHGTGTKLGDPIEATACAEVFGPRRAGKPLLIGSVKSNVGHTQAAAGLAGLMKVILSIQNSTLPRTLHITEPSPTVSWEEANMRPVINRQPWLTQDNRLRRAGVSAFGIGGTNAHVVIEEPPSKPDVVRHIRKPFRLPSCMPFLLSGHTDAVLRNQVKQLQQHIRNAVEEEDLCDVAYSLTTSRTHFRRRLVLTASNKEDLLDGMQSAIEYEPSPPPESMSPQEPRLAVLFTGQGSQWAGMGKDLCEIYPIFHETLIEVAANFSGFGLPLLEIMWSDPGTPGAMWLECRTDIAQAALFALEVALWRLWQSWGVTPEFVLGHSLGELVAAHVTGIFSLADACKLVAARGRLMQTQSERGGSMASLEASGAEAEAMIRSLGQSDKVESALLNTPTQTVISGDADGVKKVMNRFAQLNRKTKMIVVGHAFHSRHMDSVLREYQAVAETIEYHAPAIQIVSGVDGKVAKAGIFESADYWVRQMREPVRFSEGINTLAGHGINIFLELGPAAVLCGMGAQCLEVANIEVTWLPSLQACKDGPSVLQRSCADLHLLQVPINWQSYFAPFGCQRVDLPTHVFQRDYVFPLRRSSLRTLPGQCLDQQNIQHEVRWDSIKLNNASHLRVISALLQVGVQFLYFDQLEQARHVVDGLIHIWDSDSEILSQTRVFVAEAIKQLHTSIGIQFTPLLIWITHFTIGTGVKSDDHAIRPNAAPLLGILRTVRSEHPELRLRLLDLDNDPKPDLITSALLHGELECAVRKDRVLVPRMRCSTDQFEGKPFIRSDGAVLITGGFGGIGSRVARWLVSKHGIRDLVLISRHGMKATGAKALVAELSGTSRTTVIAGDVADPNFIQSIMASFNDDRPLRGVIHASGIADAGVFATMTPERFETALLPKVDGAWFIHQHSKDLDLDAFIMFSSVSGVIGIPTLANYAAANTFLDALAALRRAQGLPATSIAYGAWAGDGMASRLSSSANAHLARMGLDFVTPDRGLEVLEQAVKSTRALTVAVPLHLKVLQGYIEEQGDVPPLFNTLLAVDDIKTKKPRDIAAVLNDAQPDEQANITLNIIREVVSKVLAFKHSHQIDVDRPLQEIGVDSLAAVQIRNSLRTLTGCMLSINAISISPSLRQLGKSLLSQLQDVEASSSTVNSHSAAPANTVSESVHLDPQLLLKGSLDSSFEFENVKSDSSNSASRMVCPQSVLLTGGTGFVGAFILCGLLKQGITTFCLVRTHNDDAKQRIVSTLKDYNLWEPSFTSFIRPIVGDIAKPFLGLNPEAFDDLAEIVDAVCHCGGLVDLLRPLNDYIGPNIVSTHEVLRLASRGRAKSVHLVSTISTIPKHMGLGLSEKDQEYGYGTSKFAAEMMVSAARWRGAKASIYRLPYVTALSSTGEFRRDRGDFLHNIIVGSLEIGCLPSLNPCVSMSSVLPVDYLSSIIVSAMTQEQGRSGRDYDFINTRAPSYNDFFELIRHNASGVKDCVKFSVWKQLAEDYARAHPASSLARVAVVLEKHTDATAGELFKGRSYVRENVLGGDICPAPPLDANFVRTYLDRIRSGSKWPPSRSPGN